VLNDSKKDLLINDGSKDDPREVRADEFASDFLIPAGTTGIFVLFGQGRRFSGWPGTLISLPA
jgi:hypothetical protein